MITLSTRYLQLESEAFRGTGGVAAENRGFGFQPAFMDTRDGTVCPSTYEDGRPAPFHSLDGLPEELVVARDRRGRVAQVLGSIVAGFLLDGRFYTREEASRYVAEHEVAEAA